MSSFSDIISITIKPERRNKEMAEESKTAEIEIHVIGTRVEFRDKKTGAILLVQELINEQLKKPKSGFFSENDMLGVGDSEVSLQLRKDNEGYSLLIYSKSAFQAECNNLYYQAQIDDVLEEYFAYIPDVKESIKLIIG